MTLRPGLSFKVPNSNRLSDVASGLRVLGWRLQWSAPNLLIALLGSRLCLSIWLWGEHIPTASVIKTAYPQGEDLTIRLLLNPPQQTITSFELLLSLLHPQSIFHKMSGGVSPGRTRSIQQPLSLHGLAERLREGTHKCLTYPLPFYNACKVSFDIDVEDSCENAIHEARASLDAILRAENIVEKCHFRGAIARLIKIAQAFCCPEHREDMEIMQDFAYYWVAFEYIHCFLESRRWEWDHSKWQCLASDHEEIGGYLNKLDKAHRDMAYRSLTQLVVYTAFSEESDILDDKFLQEAIANLVKKWTCAEHRKSSDTVKTMQANLEQDIRNFTLRPVSVNGAGSTPSSQDLSSPGSASVSTRFKSLFSFWSPPDSVRSTQDGDHLRRQSAPVALPLFHSGPTTPIRPPTIRSTASESQAFTESSNADSMIDPMSSLQVSPSPAPRTTLKTTIEFSKYNQSNQEPQTVFNNVMHLVQTSARTGTGNLYEDGWIYILQIPEYREYVKIGRTTQRTGARMKQINDCLDGVVIEEIGCEENTSVFYHERLERIIFADLYNERCHFYCPCKSKRSRSRSPRTRSPRARSPNSKGPEIDSHENDGMTKHGEWFKIDAQEAVRRVQEWRNWMRQKPYEKPDSVDAGELKDDWARRVDRCLKEPKLPDAPAARYQMFMTPMYMTSGANRRKNRTSRLSGVSAKGRSMVKEEIL